jgi:hypothetical protein
MIKNRSKKKTSLSSFYGEESKYRQPRAHSHLRDLGGLGLISFIIHREHFAGGESMNACREKKKRKGRGKS